MDRFNKVAFQIQLTIGAIVAGIELMTILTKEFINSLKAPNVISIAQSQAAGLIVLVDVMNLTDRPTGKIDRCCQASPVSDLAKVVARADLIVDGQFQVLGM